MAVPAPTLTAVVAISLVLHAGVWWGASQLSTMQRTGVATSPLSWASYLGRRVLAEDTAIQAYVLKDEIHSIIAQAHRLHNNFFIPPHHRDETALLLETMGYTTAVELGVQNGGFARTMLSRWPSCTKYYLVDLWGHQDNYHDFANVDQAAQDAIYNNARTTLAPWADKTVFIRNYTSKAVALVPDGLDFVYVDARHDYCGAYEDITQWWPKIRPGGLMAGHDYRNALDVKRMSGQDWSLCMDGTKHHGAVMGAVNQFAILHGLHVSVTYGTVDNDWPSWFIRKPLTAAHQHAWRPA